jgi:hypothetical protein
MAFFSHRHENLNLTFILEFCMAVLNWKQIRIADISEDTKGMGKKAFET